MLKFLLNFLANNYSFTRKKTFALIFHYEKHDLSIGAIKNDGKMDENGQIFKKYLKYLIFPKNGKIFKKIFFKYLNVFPNSIHESEELRS